MVELWLEGSSLPTVWPIRLNEAILHAWRQLLGGRLRKGWNTGMSMSQGSFSFCRSQQQSQ